MFLATLHSAGDNLRCELDTKHSSQTAMTSKMSNVFTASLADRISFFYHFYLNSHLPLGGLFKRILCFEFPGPCAVEFENQWVQRRKSYLREGYCFPETKQQGICFYFLSATGVFIPSTTAALRRIIVTRTTEPTLPFSHKYNQSEKETR